MPIRQPEGSSSTTTDSATWRRVKAICADALEQDAGAREALVTERCGEDVEMRQQVLELLAAHERAEPSFLEQPTGGPLQVVVSSRVGQRFGAWELIEELGVGGMGVVYLARRREADFEQRAALKVMRLAGDASLTERFHRERQVLAGLEHPNIAHMLDGGTTDEGVPYFAMEYVDGRPIDRYCDEEGLSTDERLALFLEICSAVGHAHRNLVVHRDLKPSNIVVTADGRPKLLDFGIAKLLAEGPGEDVVTRFQALTPDYASPEQLEGGAITTASDVHSLGALLYRLLTGRTPFAGAGKSFPELSRERKQGPPRPSAVVDVAGARRLRGDLDSIMLKALRPEPEQRYGSVEALADDLARHRDGLPVGARRGTFAYLGGKFLRRHKVPAAAAALVALSLVGATVASNRAASVAEAERLTAEAERAKAERERAKAERREARVTDVLEESIRSLDTQRGLEPSGEAMIRRTFGLAYRGLGLHDEAVVQLREAVRLGRLEPDSREAALSMLLLAGVHYVRGDYDEAIDLRQQATDILRSLPGVPDEELINTLYRLGFALTAAGDATRAELHLREALALNRQRFGEAHPITAVTLSTLGACRLYQGDLDEATSLLEESLAAFQLIPDNSTWEEFIAHNHLARIAILRGEYDRAESEVREAVSLALARLGGENPVATLPRIEQARLSYRRGDLAAAERELRSLLDTHERSLGTDHIWLGRTLTVLGRVLTARGSGEEAEAHLRRALSLRRSQLRHGHWRIAESLVALGECLAAQGRYTEAEPLLDEGVAGLEAAFGPDFPLTGEFRQLLTTVRETGPLDAGRAR